MSQPKNRRRAARRKARANPPEPRSWIHFNLTGEARNPIGRVSFLDRQIIVGFGTAVVLRDGKRFVNGEYPDRRSVTDRQGFVTLRKIEKWIKRHGAGRSRWTAVMEAPPWSAKWERQRPGKWVCVAAGMGFA